MRTFIEELNQYARVYEKLCEINSTDVNIKTFMDCIKKCRESCPVIPFKKPKILTDKTPIKPWIKKEFKRSDGMIFEKWEKQQDKSDAKYVLKPRKFNLFAYNILNFNDNEYEIFLKDIDWTIEETKYLIEMYKKYSNLWGVIADRYSFKDRRRSIYEIRQRFHFVYDSMCEARRHPERSTHYDWYADLFNLRFLQRYYNRTKEEILNERRIIDEASKIIENVIEPITPQPLGMMNHLSSLQPLSIAAPDTPLPGSIQRGQMSGRSSSSAPESRNPSVSKNVKFVSDSTVDYTKQIDPAKDTSALRFFSRTAIGPHFRSQEIRLLSNVNQKKRNNIENVCENLEIITGMFNNELTVEYYTRLACGITAVTELKNILDTATNELINLHREYCEKNDVDEKVNLPKMPQPIHGNQVIWDKIDINSSSLSSLLKRKLIHTS